MMVKTAGALLGVRRAFQAGPAGAAARRLSDGTWTPPADVARGATADLCDVHHPESVDVVSERKIQIVQPVFRWGLLGGHAWAHGQ